jgi:hypothetical protein
LTVSPPAAEVLGEQVLAVRHAPGPAFGAAGAVGGREHHMAARPDAGHIRADRFDGACPLVPEHGGQRRIVFRQRLTVGNAGGYCAWLMLRLML